MEQQNANEEKKKEYHIPEVTFYGDLEEITNTLGNDLSADEFAPGTKFVN